MKVLVRMCRACVHACYQMEYTLKGCAVQLFADASVRVKTAVYFGLLTQLHYFESFASLVTALVRIV